ncbi:putative nucleotide sugar epimerase [Prochlorococcus marinus str. MIT 9321]|uniref:Putative nucleotide sugar epimerase n=1 Tax=Prochlorococcus marinus str. MIT 9401 TaxID=167551 RepID=A0A0A2B9J8_PROMR|nr:SDR family NAD(P)-dependent oxidoreductase [Prochlorococcus marinus]KGG02869.1 putative nucleotide sugar epimerase [Prochlorococcus marinus str. MIT 9321]KGG05492.1 putative nucleotide sugar epimerase [Prochlorococcus marinus str. MIT 9322]KGG10526.1 putative nucleotide sugar epimerase [Prochlorococcus marinus str. MIT 9401]
MTIKDINIVVTGAAGFIGAAFVERLLSEGIRVIGIDNLNNYYNILLKQKRIEKIENKDTRNLWKFAKVDLKDKKKINEIFEKYNPQVVVNLAAQAGVRYSIDNPISCIESNLLGFVNILEACRNYKVNHLIYASSSSVYGGNKLLPFSESDNVDHPLSVYAATKKSNEMLAHSYSHLFQIPCTGLRFFTVYGPFGRPDMAPMIFADSILRNKKINVFNNGDMSRDFTYIDDVVDAIYRCCFKQTFSNKSFYDKRPDPSTSFAPHRIFNVGSNNPINLLNFIERLEFEFGIKAFKRMKPMQMGDVKSTFANVNKLRNWVDYKPNTSFEKGIHNFASWYKEYFESDYYKQ